MNERETIKTMGAALEEGSSTRGVCPFCGGGGSRESSFRVLRIGPALLHYKCFRAKCPAWGYEGVGEVPDTATSTRRKAKVRVYDKPLTELPARVYRGAGISSSGKRLCDILSYEECVRQGFAWSAEDARLVIPVMDSRGFHIGCIARAVGGARRTRTLTYRESDYDFHHYPIQEHVLTNAGAIVCTEDIFSAIVVSRHVPACSALGTRFSKEMAAAVHRLEVGKVRFFFDGDTAGYTEAARCARRAEAYGLEAEIIPTPLGLDPKDLDVKTLEMLLYD